MTSFSTLNPDTENVSLMAMKYEIKDEDAVVIPAGTKHNILTQQPHR
jgi:hypothetical protein